DDRRRWRRGAALQRNDQAIEIDNDAIGGHRGKISVEAAQCRFARLASPGEGEAVSAALLAQRAVADLAVGAARTDGTLGRSVAGTTRMSGASGPKRAPLAAESAIATFHRTFSAGSCIHVRRRARVASGYDRTN